MAYRPQNEALEEPIDKILQGIQEYNNAVDRRIKSNEWTIKHINQINATRLRLLAIQIELVQIKADTW